MSVQPPLDLQSAISKLIDVALAEDIGPGDVTSSSVIPANLRFSGVMEAREPMIAAGLPFAVEIFHRVVPEASFTPKVNDGDTVAAGATLAELEGPAQGLLTAERTALNLLQHLSGIATLTRRYVDAIAGTGAVLLDTRKTIPGLRQAAKYATRMGGAQNHRMGLYDGVLIKDNHIAVCGSLAEAVRRAKIAAPGKVEVECDTLDQVEQAVRAEADIILLDNMSPEILRRAVKLIDRRAKTEASGGVTLETIRAIAESGVDFISVGRLTQSAAAVDIGLDWKACR
ncbi:carboxylating nicotinate-nucleotide diphosphorylase [Telmatospirillum sp.]|uniref:carboxylating nicotinate-nucleotide diphosphorylase n=1 Tax=Telmatospirillum sp. TaxID=2079197 RepID=UPI002846AF54|nr:carboxylating nicotinate-nucleotide diphosphorylase [Telmatospirillum sp.]MDR3436071.1 carboxylating nicotinate-nucleotide diphosphorylase [Telmatospirillum sp.]